MNLARKCFTYLISGIILIIINYPALAEDTFKPVFPAFDSLVIFSNNNIFSTNTSIVNFNNKQNVAFEYFSNEQIVRGELHIKRNFAGQIRLVPSSDFDIIDSLQLMSLDYYRFRVRFRNIAETEYHTFAFEVINFDGTAVKYEIPLFPYTNTEANFYPPTEELYLGESRQFEIVTNNIDNLLLDGLWYSAEYFNYRLVRSQQNAFIIIEPKVVGLRTFDIQFQTKKPFLYSDDTPTYKLPPLKKQFNVQSSRHVFLRIDEREIARDPNNPLGTKIHIENNGRLQIGKTYRIEVSGEVGSPLIAELFTIRRLTNDKILCDLRPYNNHKISDGYLFIKDGDVPVFITNVEIFPIPTIEKVSILRNGIDWSTNLVVKPGEIIDLRIEGKSLKYTKFHFEELTNLNSDTVLQTDIVHNYQLRVPINVTKRSLNIIEGGKNTGIKLTVREHQRPRQFDFINIDYGNGVIPTSSITHPILCSKTVRDIVLTFDRDKIDQGELLYGKQHIQIRIRLEDKAGNLVETTTLGNFMICPGEASPRFNFYSQSGCRLSEILVNNFLSKKTYTLGEWSKIDLFIEHVASSYETEGYSQRIVIYNQKLVSFDVDVSIPAGLFVQKLGDGEKLAPLFTGISFAMVAQLSFYRQGEIQQILPFKVGIGFLAQNAFNFNQDAQRDLGLILIGSLYPIKGTSRISFPLYGGMGYFLQEGKFFVLIGPGIRVSF